MKTRVLSRIGLFGLALAASLLALAVAVRPAAADGIIIPEPPPGRAIPWREIPLTVQYHRVEVTITDQVATTRVDQVFVTVVDDVVGHGYMLPIACTFNYRHPGLRSPVASFALAPCAHHKIL